MAFSLSPSIQVTERDLSVSIPNLPSSKTGTILRADTGPCNKIISITTEAELVYWFGKPTTYNYQDWFNAWNFLQYSSNLYVVRPMNSSVKNAGVGISGDPATFTPVTKDNMYNSDVAELTLQNDTDFLNNRLYFFNRNVTSKQKLGLAVCSCKAQWKDPIANEFSAVVSLGTPDGNIKGIGQIGGAINSVLPNTLVNGKYISTISVDNDSTNPISLKIGSKFIGVNNLFTVKSISNISKTITVESANTIDVANISKYYGIVKTTKTQSPCTVGTSFDVDFDFTLPFNISENVVFEFVSSTNAMICKASVIAYNDTTKTVTVTFDVVQNNGGVTSFTFTANTTISSNSTYNHFTISNEYLDSSANTATAGVFEYTYIVPSETSIIKVDSGFYMPIDSVIKFGGTNSDSYYTSLVQEAFPNESTGNDYQYVVVDVDILNNTITLDRPLAKSIKIVETDVDNKVDTTFVDIVSIPTILKGINLHSTVYDASAITTTKRYLTDVITNKTSEYTVESLIKFSDTLEYEPSWVSDEFVTVVLQKNDYNLYELVEIKLASYNSTARDIQNRNMFANEIFFYNSNYLYCKVNENDEIPKVTTSNGPLVKLFDNFGTLVDAVDSDGYGQVIFETVYPLLESTTKPNYFKYDSLNLKFTYDASNYVKSDIINAKLPFEDSELFDVNLLIAHELDINGMSEIAETRKDCVAIVAPFNYVELVGKSTTVATSSILNGFGSQTVFENKLFTRFGTYSCVYGNMKYQYDKFNDVNRWVSLGGDIAGIMANTDTNKDPWWAPAGLERGKIKNVIKLAFNPNKQNRDDLYVNSINPVISIVGEGAGIVFGQKTAISRPSALDRINVRRLLIVIEKAISTAIKYSLFEFNDEFTRSRLVGIIEPFLRTVKARRGVYDFMIQCDTNNNTSTIIDANTLVIDVYIKPTKVAEFIQLNMNITRSDANFSELVGGAA